MITVLFFVKFFVAVLLIAIAFNIAEVFIRWVFNIKYECPMSVKIKGMNYIVLAPKKEEPENKIAD